MNKLFWVNKFFLVKKSFLVKKGFFVKNLFGNEAIYALLLGGASMIIAGLLVFFVDDED